MNDSLLSAYFVRVRIYKAAGGTEERRAVHVSRLPNRGPKFDVTKFDIGAWQDLLISILSEIGEPESNVALFVPLYHHSYTNSLDHILVLH